MCGKVGWIQIICQVNQIKNPATPSSIPSHTLTRQTPVKVWEKSDLHTTHPGCQGERHQTRQGKRTFIYMYKSCGLFVYDKHPHPKSPTPLPQALPLHKCTDLKAGRICFEISNERVFPPFLLYISKMTTDMVKTPLELTSSLWLRIFSNTFFHF